MLIRGLGFAVVIGASLASADGKVHPPEGNTGKGQTALMLPDWRTCPSTWSPTEGLMITCDPVLLVELVDLDGPPTRAMLDARAGELRKALDLPVTATKRQTFQLGEVRLDGYRMPVSSRVVLGVVAPFGARKSRRMTCTTAEVPALEGLCKEVFAFFASTVELKDFQGAKSKAPWGEPVPDAANDERVRKILAAAQGGGEALRALVGEHLVVGPGLWYWLLPQDKALGSIGTKSTLATGSGPIPMRSFDSIAIGNFLSSKGAQLLFSRFSVGTVRGARADEREAFYATIPYEIANKPLSVVERGQQALIMDLQDGKLAWLELVTDTDRKPFPGDP